MSHPSDSILQRLLELHPKKIDLELTRMERLLGSLDNPEKKLPPVIHVAGTNGKGSTLAFMRAILEAGGWRVHSYTSPHLVRFHERIRLANARGTPSQSINETRLAEILQRCEAANGTDPITFFEITTAAAFVAFAEEEADIVLLEVGLGGRFDATNVIDKPVVSVITHVDHDHHEFLGTDIRGIAGEKAGIMKRQVPAVIGGQFDEVRATLEDRANALNIPAKFYGQDFVCYEESGRLIYQDDEGLMDLPLPKLKGRHQYENAAVAVTALKYLQEPKLIPETFVQGVQNAFWPARCQPLQAEVFGLDDGTSEPPEIWLDGGHNPNAGLALAATMADLEEQMQRPLYLVVGMMNNKDATAYLKAFSTLAKGVFAVPIPNQENAADPQSLCEAAERAGLRAHPAQDVPSALVQIIKQNKTADQPRAPRILIGGSLYLAGHVLTDSSIEI